LPEFITSMEFIIGGLVGAIITAILFVVFYSPDDTDAPYPWDIERKKN